MFFNDREPRSNCEDGKIDDWSYKNKHGVSYTMSQFNETISKIKELRSREKLIMENFEKSTCELSEVFNYIIKAELEGRKHVCLAADTCSELYAKKIEKNGF